MRRLIPWQRITTNINQGLLESLSVTATDIGSGKTVVYVQRAGAGSPEWSKDPFVRAQAVTIGPEHALASAALPILFPAVAVGERFYCDGGLRQNTPLSPALRLGADKVLVIGLRHKPLVEPEAPPEESMPFPGAAFLVGKILDAFLLDHIDYDLDRLRRFNAVIEAVHAAELAVDSQALRRGGHDDARRALPLDRRVHDPPVRRPRRGRGAHRARRASSRARAAAPASRCCAASRPRAAPTRPICSRTSSSTASTPPRSRASATRTRARTTSELAKFLADSVITD